MSVLPKCISCFNVILDFSSYHWLSNAFHHFFVVRGILENCSQIIKMLFGQLIQFKLSVLLFLLLLSLEDLFLSHLRSLLPVLLLFRIFLDCSLCSFFNSLLNLCCFDLFSNYSIFTILLNILLSLYWCILIFSNLFLRSQGILLFSSNDWAGEKPGL